MTALDVWYPIASVIPSAWIRGALTVIQGMSAIGLSLIGKVWPSDWPGMRIAIGLLFSSTAACQIGVQFVGRRKAVERFLEKLHQRSWNKNGGRDPDYRVSLFVERFGKLVCYYRTDGHICKRQWKKKLPEGEDGLVSHIWQFGLDPNVKSLPLNPTPEEVSQYQRDTMISPEKYSTLSWPGAAMRGCPVEISAAQGTVGVLLVECRTPSMGIEIDKQLLHDATVCGLIWKGWL